MHNEPSASPSPGFGPCPPATSVSDFYATAYRRAFDHLMTEAVPRITERPEWDEDALVGLSADLHRARVRRLDTIGELDGMPVAGLEAKYARAHIERVARVAAEVAGINTLIHWGWIKDEQLTKIGQQVIDRAGEDDPEPA